MFKVSNLKYKIFLSLSLLVSMFIFISCANTSENNIPIKSISLNKISAKKRLEEIYHKPYNEILKSKELYFNFSSLNKLQKVAEALQVLDDFNVSIHVFLGGENLYSSIPDHIKELKSLLAKNNLFYYSSSLPNPIPEELKSLIGVKAPIYLSLYSDNLNQIPEWIGRLKNLEGLYLSLIK